MHEPVPSPLPTPCADPTVAELVGEVYAQAPGPLRSTLLEHRQRPRRLLSRVAVARGVFARLKSRTGWHDGPPSLDDLADIDPGHVTALVDHVQQVSVEAVEGLVRTIASSPLLAGSAAAALLAALYMQRRQGRMRAVDTPGAPQ